MYKIYINGNALILTDTDSVKGQKSSELRLVAPYSGKTKMLLAYIDMLEKTKRFDEVVLYHDDPKLILKDLESLFKVIKASGGVVQDEAGKLLMIFRKGRWDLPKGKIEKGEKKKEAGIREVEEETGITDVHISSKLITTRHSFTHKSGRRALKKTFWYCMHTHNQPLKPQEEEEITKADWMELEAALDSKEPTYRNIRDVLEKYKLHMASLAV